ncbi:ficolin-2-like [Ostrea edulis]|uniref:ficolin-2-like n=1 Tax=Ostrea edulis TaxID=37623 RepID=UPI0024AF98D2|nr:ficolin-2-like [Ostrea edulis]
MYSVGTLILRKIGFSLLFYQSVVSTSDFKENNITFVVYGERYCTPIVLVVGTVGQQQCMKECLSRPALCGGINYKKKHLLCELVNSTEKTEGSLDYIRMPFDQAKLMDGCRSCLVDQRCVLLSSNRSHCVKDQGNLNDCAFLHTSSPHVSNGVYIMNIPVLGRVSVFCEMEMDGGGWTVFQRRLDGSENFDRTWTEYRNGFGDLRSEFWLGNDKLYYLLSQGAYEMRMDMSDFDNETRYVKYRNIAIGSETTKYVMSIFGYSGDTDDCFAQGSLPINGMKFSTKDQDNDLDSRNCAKTFHSGWWHSTCHCSNPNGLYLGGPTQVHGKGITYARFKGNKYSLKSIQIMVRRVG